MARILWRVKFPDGLSSQDFEDWNKADAEQLLANTPGATMEKRGLTYTLADDPEAGRTFDTADEADAEREQLIQPLRDALDVAYAVQLANEVIED